ncbi:MAG: cytochrome c maturation protein CcmE, partial [Euryarchaeota archaeon]|nr:cytochrome c maturation protein CcmE [Euryarchaeota archaeon]
VIPATFPLGEDLEQTTRIDVVAIGVVKQGEIRASKLLVKCPSKYEAKVNTTQ